MSGVDDIQMNFERVAMKSKQVEIENEESIFADEIEMEEALATLETLDIMMEDVEDIKAMYKNKELRDVYYKQRFQMVVGGFCLIASGNASDNIKFNEDNSIKGIKISEETREEVVSNLIPWVNMFCMAMNTVENVYSFSSGGVPTNINKFSEVCSNIDELESCIIDTSTCDVTFKDIVLKLFVPVFSDDLGDISMQDLKEQANKAFKELDSKANKLKAKKQEFASDENKKFLEEKTKKKESKEESDKKKPKIDFKEDGALEVDFDTSLLDENENMTDITTTLQNLRHEDLRDKSINLENDVARVLQESNNTNTTEVELIVDQNGSNVISIAEQAGLDYSSIEGAIQDLPSLNDENIIQSLNETQLTINTNGTNETESTDKGKKSTGIISTIASLVLALAILI
jgi:hypothetical protein